MNYRSVVILGRARLLSERGEMRQTAVLALPLQEVSAKVRVGAPVDDEEDYALPVWAGVVPIRTALAEPIADERVLPDVAAPKLSRFAKRRWPGDLAGGAWPAASSRRGPCTCRQTAHRDPLAR
jgi:hypothetical protein